ncbi:MAG TPA: amino acid adenylation domain-containing protein, partial [Stenomitos sp.]
MSDISRRLADLPLEKRALLEEKLRQKLQGATRPRLITKVERGSVIPLSFAQRRLWFMDQLEPGNPQYNMPTAMRLVGLLDVDALEKSLNEIVSRHEVLRTTYSTIDGEPVQVIHPNLSIPLSILDLQHLEPTQREAEAQRLAVKESQRPFDLGQDPMLRASLLKLGEQEHWVLATMHHIASDGWSIGVIIQELMALYTAFSQGKASPLPELSIQYADFAHWQQSYLQGEVLDQQVTYWKEKLQGAPSLLELPTDRPRPAIKTTQGATRAFRLSKALADKLQDLSRKEGATLFMTLLAAFQTLLHRYSGQEDVVVGSPIANRNRAELEPLIGFFVNTLALRADLSENPTFRQLLGQVKETTLGAYAHQDVPFEKLVEALQPERNLSHTPIFQVMFVLQNNPRGTLQLPGVSLEMLASDSQTSKFDLTLSLSESPDALAGSIEYATDLFDASTIERMVGHFQNLLESILANPDQKVGGFEILGDSERHRLLVEWNDRATDYPLDKGIHQLFEAQAEKTPDAVAVVFEHQRLTYADLNRKANQLAHYLKKQGVGPEDLVGICVERSLEMVIGLLGILKAGAAYVPLDPNYPKERLAFIMEDAQAKVLLTLQHLRGEIPGPLSIYLDSDWSIIEQYETSNLEGVSPDRLAYIIYTSGSTGRPKGVAIEHRSAVAMLHWAQETYPAEELEGTLAATSISFDLSVYELFLPLSLGHKVILAENALQLPTLPAAQEVTLVNTVPSAIAELLRSESIPSSVRVINLAGEPLPNSLAQQLYQLDHVEKVYNLYGPSEDTTYSTYALIQKGVKTTCPIGRPLPNTQLYVVDQTSNLVPVGVPGELWIGGDGLARGYLNRPELTEEKFIPNPFGEGRLYRTGDLVRYRPDGNLDFLGRIDHQVKIRGFRIELGEIETTLAKHPSVLDVVVVALTFDNGDKQLVVYLVADQTLEASELRTYLKGTLPDYMVPTHFVQLDALPLTPNGKVDRKALPWPNVTVSDEDFVEPRTETERILAALFAEILGLEKVGVETSFFELGGHSLLATQVVSRIRKVLGTEVPLRALFEHPTVSALARKVSEEQGSVLPSITPVSREQLLPLSFAQERLWFLDQLAPNSSTYNMPTALRLKGALDVAALERSLNEIIRRHESLRTTFRSHDDHPVQVIASELSLALPVIEAREEEVESLAREEASLPFDLATGPLLKAKLLRLSEEDHILLFTMHHIISDGWSTGVLVKEVAALYEAYGQNQPSPLPDLTVQYADYAVWQRERLQGENLEEQLSYWQ